MAVAPILDGENNLAVVSSGTESHLDTETTRNITTLETSIRFIKTVEEAAAVLAATCAAAYSARCRGTRIRTIGTGSFSTIR